MVEPVSGGDFAMSGSTFAGGLMTPPERESCSLRFSPSAGRLGTEPGTGVSGVRSWRGGPPTS